MLARHEFGPEGVAYLRSYLEANEAFGKRLGRLLLTHHDIERGTAWAFVPVDSPAESWTDFESGGLFRKVDPTWDEQVGGWLLAEVGQSSPRPRIVCVEDALARRQDGWLERNSEHRAFFCGDEVYSYETSDTPSADLTRRLGGATWRPAVGVVTALPNGVEHLTNRQSLTPEALEEMAVAATAIIVGAWDDEAFFFWEPREAPPRGDERRSVNPSET
jgi:hypothetical protein